MSTQTFKAIRIHDYGAADSLVLDDVPLPEPKAGQVLVRIKAAGVNPADWKFRSGASRAVMPLNFPWTVGFDCSGVVESIGAGVTTLNAGQAVYGRIPGSYAEYGVVREDELAPKPENLSFDEAASVPVGALTAWQTVYELAKIQAGQRVLIHGGAGGVGLYAVQLAKVQGAYVIATASEGNLDFVRSLGADEVIDYRTTRFESAVQDLNAVIDTVGGDLVERSFAVLRPGGILVAVVGGGNSEQVQDAAGKHQVRAVFATRAPAAYLRPLTDLFERGKIRAHVGEIFPLEEAAKAHRLSESGHGRGRIVLHIAD